MSSQRGMIAVTERAKEKNWDWLEVAKSYEKALHSESMTGSLAAETWERIGFCYSQASTQVEDVVDFKKLRQLAVKAYKSAAEHFAKEGGLKTRGQISRCNALASYLGSWLASNLSKKRKMLDECRFLGNKSLEAYENAGDEQGYGQMCNDLLWCLLERLYIASDWREMRDIAQEGESYATKAIAVLSKLGNKSELLRAYFSASLQDYYAANFSEQEEEKRNGLMRRSIGYSKRALELSRGIDNPYYAAMANWAAAFCTLLFTQETESALKYAKEMLEQGRITRDNYLKGVASYVLSFVTNWMILREGDPDKRRDWHEKVIKHAENATRFLQRIRQDYFIAQTYLFYAETYSSLARDVLSSLGEKRAVLENAVNIGRQGLTHATRSGSPEAMSATLHALSKAVHFYSDLEREAEKKTLLEEALNHRKEYINIVERVFPFNDWIRGVGKNYEGLIKAELARVETDRDKKISLLQDAIRDIEKGLSHCKKEISARPVPTRVVAAARFEDWCGGILNELHLVTNDEKILSRAIEVYGDAAEMFKKVNLPSRVAESYWRIANNQDRLGDHKNAGKNFENAFAEYKAAALRIPHFADFYLDYAAYMKAWSEIESAKFAHRNEEYTAAMNHYSKTADLLKQSELWSYLSSNFLAWSLLEHAESLSREESGEKSIEAFRKSTELFGEAKENIRAKLDRIENADEKDLANRLIKASNARGKYCLGRIAVEKAKILDQQGNHMASSKHYGAAAETFQAVAEIESEQTRRELEPLVYLCQAWQKMMMAEARASPIMYEEAAELFKQAQEHTLNESTSLLALAHSSFCKALEAGTEFEITRDATMYSATKKHIETAANYYLKAGFESSSEYAKATQRLFDAYIYMDNAKRETDPEKEAKYYIMAEKVLQISAKSFMKAKHPEKTKQVQQLVEKVREERELALSLSEVLHAPAITSSTASFVTLTPSEEMAVGLERFERADVQAKLVQHEKEIRVGEDFNLEMQIVNVGKEAVLLAKAEEILPPGFQLVAAPEYCHVEDAYLNLKGKRLDPLETEEIKLVLKPFDQGTFEITPRIVCMDENGNKMLRGLEPVAISVTEVVLPGRITTGHAEVDNLMFGGIPENYAVVLTAPSCDETDSLIKNYLEAGAKKGEITFHVTIEARGVKALAEEFQANFYLFICNPRADTMMKTLPNVFKLKGVENLTDIEIALISAFRGLGESPTGPRRACIEIVSDVLLQHHAVTTRRWLSGLLPDLRSKGFTTLAVMNPRMHPQEEVHAILGLFEGEINIYEKETKRGLGKFLKIEKMYNQKYLENELPLRKGKMQT